jgi:hypothetical protein
MRVLYSKFKRLPPGIIYFAGPRLVESGFRWAPQTFFKGSLPSLLALEGASHTRRHDTFGLLISYPVYFFHLRKSSRSVVRAFPSTKRIFAWDSMLLEEGTIFTTSSEGQELDVTVARYEFPVLVRELRGTFNAEWVNERWPFLAAAQKKRGMINAKRVIADVQRRSSEGEFWVS